MANAKLLPVVQLSARHAAASAHFSGVTLRDVDHDFDALYSMFLIVLSPGNLSGRDDWLEKSRLWRCILLQRADGGWDLSQSLAFALQAHKGAKPPPKPPKSKLRTLLGALLGDDDMDDLLDDAIEDAMTSSEEEEEAAKEQQAAKSTDVIDCPLTFSRTAIRHRLPKALLALNDGYNRRQAQQLTAQQATLRQMAAAAERQRVADAEEAAALAAAALATVPPASVEPAGFPLQTQFVALCGSISDTITTVVTGIPPPVPRERAPPPPTRAASPPPSVATSASDTSRTSRRERRVRPRVPVERIWATVLALNTLEEMDSCWLVDDDAPEPWRTVVDAGAEFLQAQAALDRRVRKLLKGDELKAAAERARKDWRAIQEHNVGLLRDTDVINRFTALTHIQRGSARVVRSLMTDHGCVRACLRACVRACVLRTGRKCH
jgi:hypothetical protein